MYPIDELFLVNQVRHKEFIQESEKVRLLRSALKNQPDGHGLGSNIIEWMRAKFLGNVAREKSIHQKHGISYPCCAHTES